MTAPGDFSTASVLRMARRSAERLGVEVAGGARQAGSPGPRAPLAEKRALLAALLAARGVDGVLAIADELDDAPEDAVALALTPARDMADLLERWARLEAYIHSRHRVAVSPDGADAARLQHRSLVPGEPPLPAESLLVAAILTGLAERIGVRDLRVTIGGEGGGESGLRREDGRWRGALALERWRPAEWRMCWAPAVASAAPSLAPAVRGEPPGDSAAVPTGDSAAGLAERLRQAVAADPARRWSVSEAARRFGLSPRSLQRRLREEGRGFSDILAEARVACAARHLVDSPFGAAEIGFAAGFSDQAHFSRVYKRATGFTPAAYRAAFAKDCFGDRAGNLVRHRAAAP